MNGTATKQTSFSSIYMKYHKLQSLVGIGFAVMSALQGLAATVDLPASAALAAGTSTALGFRVRTVQAPHDEPIANNLGRALGQLNGTLRYGSSAGALAGTLVPNEAALGPLPDGGFITDTVNFEKDGNAFDLLDNTDLSTQTVVATFSPVLFPGIPGNAGSTDQFAAEAIGFVQLPAGTTTLGIGSNAERTDVNDDDGFVLFVGTNPRSAFNTKVAEYIRNAPGFAGNFHNETRVTVNAPKAGIYPFRLVYWQGGRGANLQMYTVLDSTERILLNDPNDARALKVYSESTVPAANGPYVAEYSPSAGSDGNSSAAPVTALIVDGAATVATTGVKLTFNGKVSTPQSLTKTGDRISLSYSPNTTRPEVNNAVQLDFTDSLATVNTVSWSFGSVSAGGSSTQVTGQWDFDGGDLGATVGKALAYYSGAATGTDSKGGAFEYKYGTTAALGIADIGGKPAKVIEVPGNVARDIGLIADHGIKPNGGGTKVNQYTLIMDVLVDTTGPGAASLLQIDTPVAGSNTSDGDLFWQGNNFGQGTSGYNGRGTFTAGTWHRVVAAYDEAATPPVVAKFVDGIKQDDWTANQGLDAARRAMQPTVLLFGDGDQDERRRMWLNSIQFRSGRISDAEAIALAGPSAAGIPQVIPSTSVTAQWDFDFGDLGASAGKALQYYTGTATGTDSKGAAYEYHYGTTTALSIPDINGVPAKVIEVPGNVSRDIGLIAEHGIKPNGGGTKVNQYTLIMDVLVDTTGPGAASLLQVDTPTAGSNTSDGDLFWQGNNFGQGTSGYNGRGTFTSGTWHRVIAAYDEAATPPVVTKYVDGIKQDDWTANQGLDAARRAMQPTVLLLGDGDQDERRRMWLNSVQFRAGKLTDAQCALLGGPSAAGIPVAVAESNVTGQWDFEFGDLGATAGKALQYYSGAATGTDSKGGEFTYKYGTTAALGIPDINGVPAKVIEVPGNVARDIGLIVDHGIKPNGGGTKVNQYTLVMDIYVDTTGPGAASLLQVDTPTAGNNTSDGDLFWQGNNFGQGTSGYNGRGTFTAGGWHRVVAAYDEAATPPVVTKYVDGIKQDDWTTGQGLDAARRALQPTALLFGDGDQDERRRMWVSSIQFRSAKLSDAQCVLLGGPSASGIPLALPESAVTAQWDFNYGDLGPTVGKALQYYGGTATGTDNKGGAYEYKYGTTTALGISDINGVPAKVIEVPGNVVRDIGLIADHGIKPNGGGAKVNQYTLIMDILVDTTGPGAASLLQIDTPLAGGNTSDGDLFWQGSNFGQGTDGYKGKGTFTAGAWHRVVASYDEAATPPVVVKYVDGIFQDNWTTGQGLDAARRAMLPTVLLLGDGDQDERRRVWLNSVQFRAGRMSNADIEALGGPSADGIPAAFLPTDPAGAIAGSLLISPKDLVDGDSNPLPIAAGSVKLTGATSFELTAGGLYGFANKGNAIQPGDLQQFAYESVTGDFDRAVQITGFKSSVPDDVANYAGGLEARVSSDPLSPSLFVNAYNPLGANSVSALGRVILDQNLTGFSRGYGGVKDALPNQWLRLRRVGDYFTAYVGNDGVNWTMIAERYNEWPASLLVGVYSQAAGYTVTDGVGAGNLNTATVSFANYGVTKIVDKDAPRLVSVGTADKATIGAKFSEPLRSASIANLSNYQLSQGTVTGARLGISGDSIYLTVTGLTSDTFTLTIKGGVTDTAGNAIAANSSASGKVSNWNSTDIGLIQSGIADDRTAGDDPFRKGQLVAVSSGATETELEIIGGGSNAWSPGDYIHYANNTQTLNGDFEVTAEVTRNDRPANTAGWANSGLMLRESTYVPGLEFTQEGTKAAMVALTTYIEGDAPGRSAIPLWRSASGGGYGNGGPVGWGTVIGGVKGYYPNLRGINASGHTDPASTPLSGRWLKIKRVGNTFTFSNSHDGRTWNAMGSTDLELSSSLIFGFSSMNDTGANAPPNNAYGGNGNLGTDLEGQQNLSNYATQRIRIGTNVAPPAPLVTGSVPNGLAGQALTNIIVDTASKTITADLPVNGDQGYLIITPKVNITSTKVVGGKLVVTYQ